VRLGIVLFVSVAYSIYYCFFNKGLIKQRFCGWKSRGKLFFDGVQFAMTGFL
jgi:hypothetical protein